MQRPRTSRHGCIALVAPLPLLLLLLLAAIVSAALNPAASDNAATCDESDLKRDAMALLTAHFDVEFGAVTPGNAQHVGFQHLKTADALFAAQAIAHDDFDRATEQFRNVLKHQRRDGHLPHLIYGSSVPSTLEWLATNLTFHPGPAFWNQSRSSQLPASRVLAPPIAADVAWQIFQLSPYDTALGVVGYKRRAVAFLCDVYAPLKLLQQQLLATRTSNGTKLLAAHHPWETFTSLSPHWLSALAPLKFADDYVNITQHIPRRAAMRFAVGAASLYPRKIAIDDLFAPMIYLAACLRHHSTNPCGFRVHDVEFNSLALRSAHALVRIARVLVDHAGVCDTTTFTQSHDDLVHDVQMLRDVESRLRFALLGDMTRNATGLWNATTHFFDDTDVYSPTANHSLRGVLPVYAVAAASSQLPQLMLTGVMDHFFAPSASAFTFLCATFPSPLFTCRFDMRRTPVTLPLYNYFVQRAMTNLAFPGVAEYIRNKTRDMVCAASLESTTAQLAGAYDARDAAVVTTFDDGFVGATLAVAAVLNILLPAVATPPNPDAPPIDHRMLTLIMCLELVVAFVVALGCFLFSVYFVIKRPRDAIERSSDSSKERGDIAMQLPRVLSTRRKSLAARSSEGPTTNATAGGGTNTTALPEASVSLPMQAASDVRSSLGDRSLYSEMSEQDDLAEPLLSDDEDVAYGSFDAAEIEPLRRASGGHDAANSNSNNTTSWRALKDAVAAISPW